MGAGRATRVYVSSAGNHVQGLARRSVRHTTTHTQRVVVCSQAVLLGMFYTTAWKVLECNCANNIVQSPCICPNWMLCAS